MNEELYKILSNIGEYKEKGDEIQVLYCPFCNGGQHKDKYTFAINKTTGAYNCLRGSCGQVGNIYTLGKHLGVQMERQSYFREYRKPKKVYKKPEIETKDLTQQVINYFNKRGISKETLIKKQGNNR